MTPGDYYCLLDWALAHAGNWAGARPDEAARVHRGKLKALRVEITARRRKENGTTSIKGTAFVCRGLNLHR